MIKKAKLPKGKVTIDRLLSFDEVNEVIDSLAEHRSDIKELIAISTDKDTRIHILATPINFARLLGLLDMAKDLELKANQVDDD